MAQAKNVCSIIMTYRCVCEIGRYTRIIAKGNDEYAIVSTQLDDDFWSVFPLNTRRPVVHEDETEEADNTVRLLHAAQEAEASSRNEPVLMLNNYVGGSVASCGIVCQFKAKTLENLEEYVARRGGRLSYQAACLLLVALYNQHDRLLCKRKMIPFYSLKDIIVVDDMFMYANPSKLLNLRRFRATVTVPYNRHGRSNFYAPEIWNRRTIPYVITPEATLFSMAYMITVCLFGDLPTNYQHDESHWAERLDQIYSTKMYWCLLRCLYTEPERRRFVII